MKVFKYVVLLVGIMVLTESCGQSDSKQKLKPEATRPNVILIMTDDQVMVIWPVMATLY